MIIGFRGVIQAAPIQHLHKLSNSHPELLISLGTGRSRRYCGGGGFPKFAAVFRSRIIRSPSARSLGSTKRRNWNSVASPGNSFRSSYLFFLATLNQFPKGAAFERSRIATRQCFEVLPQYSRHL